MGLFSANLKTELKKPNPEYYYVAELSLPAATRRYASANVGLGAGFALPRVQRWDPIRQAGSGDRSQGIELPTAGITISDLDGDFMKIYAGTRGNEIIGSASTIKLVSPNVTSASDYFTRFAGKLLDSPEQGSDLTWHLKFRVDDLALNRYVPKIAVTQLDWPQADPGALGQFGPSIYGTHDSSGYTAKGFLPTLYLDRQTFFYGGSVGRLKTITNVYADGTKQTSGFSITNPIRNGVQWTGIDFTADQTTKVITFDCDGYETVGDGSGSVITSPSDQLKHFLVNFVFGDYRSGNWLTDASAPIDTASFSETATYLTSFAKSVLGSRFIGGRQQLTGRAVLEEWLGDMPEVSAFWTNLGKLGIRPDDPFMTATYVDDPYVRYDRDQMGAMSIQQNMRDLIDRVTVQYAFSTHDSQFYQSLTVRDRAITAAVGSESRELHWAKSSS